MSAKSKTQTGRGESNKKGAKGPSSKRVAPLAAVRKRVNVSPPEQAEELTALRETLLDITRGLSLPDLLEGIVKRAVKLLNASGGGMYLNEPEQRQVRCMVSFNTPRDFSGTALAYGEGAAGRVAQTGKPLLIEDYATWSGRAAVDEEDKPFRAVICAPMRWQGNVTGVVIVLREKKFTRKELSLLALFADHAAVAVENARLVHLAEQELHDRKQVEADLSRRLHEFSVLYENGLLISRLRDPHEIGKQVMEALTQELFWHHIAIRLRKPDSDELELIAFHQPRLTKKNRASVAKKFNTLIHSSKQGLSGWAIQTGRIIRAGNVHEYPQYVETYPGIRSGLYVPLMIGERVTGCISVESEEADTFTEQDERLLATLAAQAAVAFENARLYRDIQQELSERQKAEETLRESEAHARELFEVAQRQAQELALLDKVRTAIAQEVELGALLRRVVESISETFGYALVSLYLLKGQELVLQHQVGYDRVIQTIPISQGITGRVARTGKAVLLRDVKSDVEFLEAMEEIVSEICVPLLDNGEPVGVLNVESTKGVQLTEADLNLMSALSAHIGMAISQARLFDDLRNRNQIFSALQESTLALMKQTDLPETLRSIIEQAAQLGNTSHGYIYLVEPGGDEMRVILGVGIFKEYQDRTLKRNEGLAGKVWQTAAPLNVRDYSTWEGRSPQYADAPLRAVVGVPLIYGSRVIGVLGLSHLDPEKSFLDEDMEVLSYFARLASIALENAGLFTRVQQELAERKQAEESLLEAETKYRDLVERLPLVVYTSELGENGRWFYVSPNILDLFGFTVEEWMADPNLWYRQIHPDDREAHQAVENKAYAEHTPFEDEYRIFTKDGRQIWVRDSGIILPPRDGSLPIVQGVLTDVTERREMRDALLESEQRYRLLVDSSPSAIALHQDGRIIFVNEAALRLMGAQTPEDLIGKSVIELVHPDYRQVVAQRIREAVNDNKPGALLEEKFLRLDGSVVDVEVSSSSLMYRGAPAVQVIIHDITERKRSENALLLAEKKYRSLVEQMPLVVYLDNADEASASFYISPQIEELLGYPASAYITNPTLWHQQIYPEDYERAITTISRTLRQGEAIEEYRLVTRDGDVVWVRDTSVLIRDDAGNPRYIQGFFENITEQKRAQRLQESVYEIARAGVITQSLDELYAKIHAVLQQLLPTQFFYIATYDRERDIVSFPYFQDAYDVAPPPSKAGRGLTEYVLRTRQPLLATPQVTEKLLKDGEIELLGADSIEWLGVPLIVHDQAIGVMVVQSYDETIHFGPRDVEVMAYVSTQVANAIERKRAEDALKRSEAFSRSIVENEPECVKIVGEGGILQYMNPAGLGMIEADSLEMVRGASIYSIVVPEHRQAFQELTEQVLRGEQGTLQFEVVGMKGTRRWLDTHAVPLFNEQGRVDSLLGITRDITERKQAEALQNAVYRIAKSAETALSVNDLFPQIHQIISSVMPAENFFITLYDEARNVLEFPYFKDVLDEPYLAEIEPGMGLTAYVLRTGKSLLCTQAVHDELERRGEVRLLGVPSKIWLGVPLIVEERPIGVMVVQHYTDPNAYGEREQHILEFVSSQVATAIRRKQSEQALRESEARYRAIIEQATEGMIIYDLGTLRVLEANPAYQKLLGYAAAEINSLTLYDISSHDRENINNLVERIKQERQVWIGERRHRRKDGSLASVEVSGSIITFRGQEALLVVVRDVSERRKAEEELQKSEERYRTLVNGMLDGVYQSTHEGKFTDVNPAMVRLFGYSSREEMLQVDIKKDLYFAPEERESLFLDTAQEKVDVFRMRRKDGSEIWVEDHGRYVHDDRGNVIYHEGILRDVTQRIHSEREINRLLLESQQRLRHVEALRSIDLAIGSSMDLRTTLNILLSYVKSLLTVDAADILLFNRNSQSFEFAAANGFRSRVSEAAFHAMGRAFGSRVALERRIIQFYDPPEAQSNRDLAALWKAEGFVTYTGIPLIAKGDLKGVLEIHHRSVFHSDTQWTDLLQNFSTQAAIAIENAQLFNDLQNTNFELSLAYDATIEGWARALELRENEPPGHFQRVTEMTLNLARAMGMRDSELVHVRRGALLHDIGKMAIPDSILRKTGPLTEEEWAIMRMHPIHARDLLASVSYLRPALDIPCFHHERWDGSGYPNGLKGEEIPLAARVFALADVYDSSTSDRFHRRGLSSEQVMEYIKSESGKHFDPAVVGVFLQLISKGQLAL